MYADRSSGRGYLCLAHFKFRLGVLINTEDCTRSVQAVGDVGGHVRGSLQLRGGQLATLEEWVDSQVQDLSNVLLAFCKDDPSTR